LSMVTRELGGLDVTDPERAFQGKVSALADRLRSRTIGLGAMDRTVMKDSLDVESLVDYTLPQNQAAGRQASSVQSHGVGSATDDSIPHESRIPMSQHLDATSRVDMTLPSNIAQPPGSSPEYYPPSVPIHRQEQFHLASRKGSFASPTQNIMADKIDEKAKEDLTDPARIVATSTVARGDGNEVTGLTMDEMKKRRMSYSLTDEAKRDSTTFEGIRRPTVVDQGVGP